MSEWGVWDPGGAAHAPRLVELDGLDEDSRLVHAIALRDVWPAGVGYRFDGELPRGLGYGAKQSKPAEVVVPDALDTRSGAHVVVSERLAVLLIQRGGNHLEQLPIKLLAAKGKKWPSAAALAGPHFLINPVGYCDCIDESASGAKRSKILPAEIEQLRRLVIVPKRIDPAVALIRPKGLRRTILVRKSLIDELLAAGMTNVGVRELADFELL